jgi:hypothetical protein
LLFALLLPALVLGTVVGGRTTWLHSHGADAGHVHLPPQDVAVRGASALAEWHAGQHEDDDRHRHQDRGPHPTGLVVDLPAILLASSPTTSSADPIGSLAFATAPAWACPGPLVETGPRPDLCRSGWPPQRGRRSGIAALLRTSHAILI